MMPTLSNSGVPKKVTRPENIPVLNA